MPYKAEFIERLFFIRWDAPPSATETAEVVARLAEGAQRLGREGPLAFVCSVAPSAKLPDAQQRRHIDALLTAVLQDFVVAHMIFEGNELQLIAQRLIMQAALLLANIKEPSILRIHGRAEPAEQELARVFGPEVSALFRRARALELVA